MRADASGVLSERRSRGWYTPPRSAPCHGEMAPSILLSALALAAYWDYEVFVGSVRCV